MIHGSVLIIDDDRGTREALQHAFVRRNWEVVMTVTETEGLVLLSDYEPDWVLVSWDQLEGTGSGFVRSVRARVRKPRITLLTDSGSHAGRFVKSLKPDLTFNKPILADEVFRACQTLVADNSALVGRAV